MGDTNSLESCTCRGPQKTYPIAHKQKKNHKNEKNTVLGAFVGCTIGKSHIIRGLLIQQVTNIKIRELYN